MGDSRVHHLRAAALLPVLSIALPASAHDAGRLAADVHWHPDPLVTSLLGIAMLLYALGLGRLWRKAGVGRGITLAQASSFAAGMAVLALALVSPVHAWSEQLLWVHMLQHELIMVAAALLLVLGRPLEAWTWALPATGRRMLGGWSRAGPWRALWLALTLPLGAWIVHAAVLWLWHAPALFQAALRSEAVHTWQHSSFLAAAAAFWWAVLGGDARRPRFGVGACMLFSTMLLTGALGALLTFSTGVWYPAYAAAAAAGSLDALEDQQLAGLIMWVPGGAVYMAAALAIAARALRSLARRTDARDALAG
jgi:putative membrane protein